MRLFGPEQALENETVIIGTTKDKYDIQFYNMPAYLCMFERLDIPFADRVWYWMDQLMGKIKKISRS